MLKWKSSRDCSVSGSAATPPQPSVEYRIGDCTCQGARYTGHIATCLQATSSVRSHETPALRRLLQRIMLPVTALIATLSGRKMLYHVKEAISQPAMGTASLQSLLRRRGTGPHLEVGQLAASREGFEDAQLVAALRKDVAVDRQRQVLQLLG